MIKTAFSTQADPTAALADIRQQLGGMEPRLVLYFVSPAFDQQGIARAFADSFHGAQVIGCSSSGEIVTGRMLDRKSVV